MRSIGKYYNGIAPVKIKVSCIYSADALSIYDLHTNNLIVVWKKENIFHDENQNTALVIGHKLDRAKVELENEEFSTLFPARVSPADLRSKDFSGVFKWLGIILLTCGCFWFSIPLITKVIAQKIPYSFEVSASNHIRIDEYFKVCSMTNEQSLALKSYVDFLYPKNNKEKLMPVEVSIGRSSLINAFTFPGGKIVLMSGLVAESKSPEELLGVLGHELGHVVARDSASFLVRGSLLTTFFGLLTGDFNSTFAVSPQIFLSTAALTFDRDMEVAADAYAASRLNMLNVSTSGLRSFFSRRSTEEVISAPDFILRHPENLKRLALIKETYPKEELPPEIMKAWPVIKSICN